MDHLNVPASFFLKPAQDFSFVEKKLKSFLVFLSFLLFFLITFVNDYSFLFGVPAFYLLWLSIVCIRIFLRVRYTRTEVFSQFLVSFLFLPFFFREALSGYYYSHSLLFPVLYINALFLWVAVLEEKKVIFFTSFLILLFFSFFSIISLLAGDSRSSVFFGPNVLYRIYAFLFAVSLISGFLYLERSPLNPKLLIVFLAFSVCMASTGSRGALVVFFVIFLYLIYHMSSFFSKKFRVLNLVSVLFVFSFVAYLGYNYFESFVARLYFFDLENNSEAVRLSFYYSFIDSMNSASFKDLLIGVGSGEYVEKYGFHPHNIFIESAVYHGFFILLYIVVSYFFVFYYGVRGSNTSYLIFPFLGFWVGAILSGDFFYSYPIISTASVLMLIKLQVGRKHLVLNP